MHKNVTHWLFPAVLVAALAAPAVADMNDGTRAKVEAALTLPYRGDADLSRDANRQPLKALDFMGLRDDMKVFEFAPGGGWYTKILGPVLKDSGELIIGYRESWLANLDEILATESLEKVRRVNLDMGWNSETRAFDFNGIDFASGDLDMFLNIREYHNLHGDERGEFNRAVFDALKPGGVYVVIDHTRRHMQADSPENWRREDPVSVLVEIQEAGFELARHSDMFYRFDDTLEYEVGRRSVSGNTDRFFFVFVKPA